MRAGLALVLALAAGPAPAAAPTIVFCAPGYPGSTTEAQPTMDAFARFVVDAASLKPGGLAAAYFETEEAGVARLRAPDAALAIVTLPFYAKHRKELALTPRLQAVSEAGSEETWSLVARRGAVASPASLDGWEIVGIPAYAPGFVRSAILGSWGALPATTRLTFSARVPSSLAKAASGQKLAVLVDAQQEKALPTLPSGKDLEVVARGKPLPASVVCSVGAHEPAARIDALVATLAKLADRPGGREALEALRLRGFSPVDARALDAALEEKGAASGRAP